MSLQGQWERQPLGRQNNITPGNHTVSLLLIVAAASSIPVGHREAPEGSGTVDVVPHSGMHALAPGEQPQGVALVTQQGGMSCIGKWNKQHILNVQTGRRSFTQTLN